MMTVAFVPTQPNKELSSNSYEFIKHFRLEQKSNGTFQISKLFKEEIDLMKVTLCLNSIGIYGCAKRLARANRQIVVRTSVWASFFRSTTGRVLEFRYKFYSYQHQHIIILYSPLCRYSFIRGVCGLPQMCQNQAALMVR